MLEPVFIYQGVIHRVIDGDTLDVQVDLGFRVAVRLQIRVRDLRCPERNTVEGQRVTVAARAFEGATVRIQSYKDQRSFERWIADVWVYDPAFLPAGSTIDDLIPAWKSWGEALRTLVAWTDPGR